MKMELLMAAILGGAVSAYAAPQSETSRDTEAAIDDTAEATSDAAEKTGNVVSSSVAEAAQAVKGQPARLDRGMLRDGGEVRHTVTTNPLGFFTGTGVNAAYQRPLSERFSVVAGGSFARANAGDGAATRIGVLGGANYFLVGQNNEGLYVGPRAEVGLGRETSGQASSFGSFNAAGEVGYNWISSAGLTAGAGAGVRAGFGGSTDTAGGEGSVDVDGRRAAPYMKIGLGYSW